VKNRFQAFAFKCNLCRYTSERKAIVDEAASARTAAAAEVASAGEAWARERERLSEALRSATTASAANAEATEGDWYKEKTRVVHAAEVGLYKLNSVDP
jgi:biotin synthase-like enzyme